MTCELCKFFGNGNYATLPSTSNATTQVRCGFKLLELHHIQPGCRADVLSNIIMLEPEIHTPWGHRFRADLTVLCVAVKVRKGEFDLQEMEDASGKNWTGGYFDTFEPKLEFDVSKRAFMEAMEAMEALK